jgi:hypothetical protein
MIFPDSGRTGRMIASQPTQYFCDDPDYAMSETWHQRVDLTEDGILTPY